MGRLRRAIRSGLGGLTTRGRSFLAAGLAAGACALALGQRDLLRVAVLLVALPIAAAIALTATRHRLAMSRELQPTRLTAGGLARVRVRLRNLTPGASRLVMAEDHVPLALGPSPRFVVDGLGGGRGAAVSYTMTCQSRGRYHVGPLRLRLADPFGMCEVTRSFTATDTLLVLPRVYPLTGLPAGGRWAGSGTSSSLAAAASGEDDITTREYRHGDDLRRVHWRSTARRGELMVRQDEQPRLLRATVLLDARRSGHRGEGPVGSLEWAVSCAASAALHLTAAAYTVRLLTGEPARSPSGAASATWTAATGGLLLDGLAELTAGPDQGLPNSLEALGQGGDGVIVAVLGDLDAVTATRLAGSLRAGSRGYAVLLDVAAWSGRDDNGDDVRLRQQRAQAVLEAARWSVVTASPRDGVADVWTEVLARPVGGDRRPVGAGLGASPANGTPNATSPLGTTSNGWHR